MVPTIVVAARSFFSGTLPHLVVIIGLWSPTVGFLLSVHVMLVYEYFALSIAHSAMANLIT